MPPNTKVLLITCIIVVVLDIILCLCLALRNLGARDHFPKGIEFDYWGWIRYCPCLLETWPHENAPMPLKLCLYLGKPDCSERAVDPENDIPTTTTEQFITFHEDDILEIDVSGYTAAPTQHPALPQKCSDPDKWYHPNGPAVYLDTMTLMHSSLSTQFMAAMLDENTLVVGGPALKSLNASVRVNKVNFTSIRDYPDDIVIKNATVLNPDRKVIGNLVRLHDTQDYIDMGLYIFKMKLSISELPTKYYQIMKHTALNSPILHLLTRPTTLRDFKLNQWFSTEQKCTVDRKPVFFLCNGYDFVHPTEPLYILATHCVDPYQIVGTVVFAPNTSSSNPWEVIGNCPTPVYEYDHGRCPLLTCIC